MPASIPEIKGYEDLSLKDLGEKMVTWTKQMAEFWEERKKGDRFDMTEAERTDVVKANDAMAEAKKRLDLLREDNGIYERTMKAHKEMLELENTPANGVPHPNGGGVFAQGQLKSLGQSFVESAEYKAMKRALPGGGSAISPTATMGTDIPDITLDSALKSVKAPLTNATGFPPPFAPDTRVVPFAARRVVVTDLIPSFDTTFSAIHYVEETTFTNNAAGVLEGASKPASGLGLTRRTANVETIAHYINVTNQQLEDVPQVRALIDDRLTFMLQLAEETEILNGSGTDPDLLGFYNKSGVNTQALGADNAPNAIMKGFTKIRTVGFAEPSGVVFHPTDWQNIRLLQTTIGSYIWGDPSEAGPERIWGVPIVQTVAATLGQPVAGDFRLFSQLARRMGIRVEVGLVNDDFIKNQQTIRAELREALLIYRASAFTIYSGF
jgi:HK97 family phage major capsid protein